MNEQTDSQQIDGWESINDFRAYLSETLIPDLIESGMEATAQDFQTCLAFFAEYESLLESLQIIRILSAK